MQQKVRKKKDVLMLIFSTARMKEWLALKLCSYVLRDNKPGFALSLFLIFFAKIKAFVIMKLFLKKKKSVTG